MSPCDLEMLSRYVDRELDFAARRALEAHLRNCLNCRRELNDLRRMDRIVVSWGAKQQALPEKTERRILASVERRQRVARPIAFLRMMPAAVGTFAAALLVLVTANLGLLYQAKNGPDNPNQAMQRLIEKRSAPLVNDRRRSAILGGRVPVAPTTPDRHHVQFNVE